MSDHKHIKIYRPPSAPPQSAADSKSGSIQPPASRVILYRATVKASSDNRTEPPVPSYPLNSFIRNISSGDAFQRALELLPPIDQKSADAFLAHFSNQDNRNEPEWLNLLARYHGTPGHRDYNSKRAHELFLQAANAGYGPACYNLATSWEQGKFGRIDIARANDWYMRAFELGHGCAAATLAEKMLNDPRARTDDQFRLKANELLTQSALSGAPWGIYTLATRQLQSEAGTVRAAAISSYHHLSDNFAQSGPGIFSTLNLALRHMLGFDVPQDSKAALHFLDRLSVRKRPAAERDGSDALCERLVYIAKSQSDIYPLNRLANNAVQRMHRRETTSEDMIFTAELLDRPYKEILSDYLWMAGCLAAIENDSLFSQWSRIKRAVDIMLLGSTEAQLERSTRDFGLSYNLADSNGYPVPGPHISPEVARDAPFGIFTGLTGTRSGDIALRFSQTRTPELPMMTPEDINVLMVLAFGEPSPIFPDISLEPVATEREDGPRYQLSQKVWDPPWLGHTLVGKTLYAADYLAGTLAFAPEKFPIDSAKPPFRAAATALCTRLSETGGENSYASRAIRVGPRQMFWRWAETASSDFICDVTKLTMGVDGFSFISNRDGTKSIRHMNDATYSCGRLGIILTDSYDDMASLWPVFERTRQINSVLYALTELRKRGFKPNDSVRSQIQASRARLQNAPALPLAERLVLG